MKTVILGLDGATWYILEPLARSGEMPNLKSLMAKGSWGPLESTIPPVTGAAWLSLATGLNPGKTGVIDFLKRTEDFNLKPVSSSDFKNISLWDILSNYGKTCAILDYPMLYPPYKIKGFMLSTWGGEVKTYPRKLEKALKNLLEDYDIFMNYHEEKYDDVNLFIRHLNQALEKKLKITRQLLTRENWNLFITVIPHTDWIQHRLWRYIDERHPLYNKQESLQILPHFQEFWKKIDKHIGELASIATYFFIVSDHGFGSQYGCFNLPKWLEIKGYIKRKRSPKTLFKPIASVLKGTFIAKLLPTKVREQGIKLLKPISEIDMAKSKVYILGHTIPFGALYLNSKNPEQTTALKNKLIDSLRNIKKDINQDVRVTVFDTKKIYVGNKTELLPDIIFTINNWSCVIIKDFKANFLYKDAPYSNRHTGSHRLNGIFLAYGPDIKNGFEVKGLKIYDIAPTILHMFNVPIPKEMDGRVIKEIFKSESEIAKRKPIYIDESFKKWTKERIEKLKKIRKI